MTARRHKRTAAMARATPLTTVGSTAAQEQPNSGVVVKDKATRRTVVIRGVHADIAALQPAQAATYEDDWVVQSSRLAPGRGGLTELTIDLITKTVVGDPGSEVPVDLKITWEIDWMGVELPLTKNHVLFPTQTGEDYQTACDEIEAWRNSPQQRKRKYQIPLSTLTRDPNPDVDADWVKLTGVALQVANKLSRGVEAFQAFAPVVVKNTIYDNRPPSTGGCGQIETPSTSVPGYLYLKMGDSLVQQSDGTWVRTERWQGAEDIDADLYAGAT